MWTQSIYTEAPCTNGSLSFSTIGWPFTANKNLITFIRKPKMTYQKIYRAVVAYSILLKCSILHKPFGYRAICSIKMTLTTFTGRCPALLTRRHFLCSNDSGLTTQYFSARRPRTSQTEDSWNGLRRCHPPLHFRVQNLPAWILIWTMSQASLASPTCRHRLLCGRDILALRSTMHWNWSWKRRRWNWWRWRRITPLLRTLSRSPKILSQRWSSKWG